MIDNLALGLSHGLMMLAAFLLLNGPTSTASPARTTPAIPSASRTEKPRPMRDLAFIAFLLAFFGMGFKRPFLLVLVYVYIDIVSPQRLTYLLLNSVPISLIAVALAVGGWILADDKRDTRVGGRQVLIVLLLLYCWRTTIAADFPVEALEKWDWVWKALAFAAFLPLTLRTRLRIEALLLFMILAASSIIIVGGIKTIASGGGGYGQLNLMVDNN